MYSLHFTAAWVKRRDGGMGVGWVWGGTGSAVRLHEERWRWWLWVDVFRQGKEEKPGWKWVVQKQPTNKQRTFFFCYSINWILFCFFFFVFFPSNTVLLLFRPAGMKVVFSCFWHLSTNSFLVWNTFFCDVCSCRFHPSCPTFSPPWVCWMKLLLSLLLRMHFLLKFLDSWEKITLCVLQRYFQKKNQYTFSPFVFLTT